MVFCHSLVLYFDWVDGSLRCILLHTFSPLRCILVRAGLVTRRTFRVNNKMAYLRWSKANLPVYTDV